MSTTVLVLNSGSSSIKFELFEMPAETRLAKGLMERIGEESSCLTYTLGNVKHAISKRVDDHAEGLQMILKQLTEAPELSVSGIGAVGHRVVHGGEGFSKTTVINNEVIAVIEKFSELAPLHNPANLLGINVASKLLPSALQVAVFDTAFHQTMAPEAFTYPIPYELYQQLKIRRYGFHGTSHRFVMMKAAELLGRKVEQTNLITAHLGNGGSICAIRDGTSVDTTMGLTPLQGLMMGTRCGDIDPAIIPFLATSRGMSLEQIDQLMNKRSGVLGVSGLSNDLRVIEQAAAAGHERAALALDMYCYSIKKYIGAYTAVLGTVHALVFTAGVGENSDVVRRKVLHGMEALGYVLNEAQNQQARGIILDIATEQSPSRILIIPTNEELMIARDTYQLTMTYRL